MSLVNACRVQRTPGQLTCLLCAQLQELNSKLNSANPGNQTPPKKKKKKISKSKVGKHSFIQQMTNGTTASENVFIAEETSVLIVSKFELDKLVLASVSLKSLLIF